MMLLEVIFMSSWVYLQKCNLMAVSLVFAIIWQLGELSFLLMYVLRPLQNGDDWVSLVVLLGLVSLFVAFAVNHTYEFIPIFVLGLDVGLALNAMATNYVLQSR